MKPELVDEVIACLGSERKLFHYYQDRFCFDLLDFEMKLLGKSTLSIAELKKTKFNRFLHKPAVAKALSYCGNGYINRDDLPLFSSPTPITFNLSLAKWGEADRGWDQTSRNQCNLVLQINFDRKHDRQYQQYIKPSDRYGPFEYWGHPVRQGDRNTLSWVRMDVDFDTGEALIEEVQNDWLREAREMLAYINKRRRKQPKLKPNDVYHDIDGSYDEVSHYVKNVLSPYQKIWAEVSMLAALRFISDDLGLFRVYYHTLDTGKKLKAVPSSPPKSLYSALPKQFGFEITDAPPMLLANHGFSKRCIKAIKQPLWYYREV